MSFVFMHKETYALSYGGCGTLLTTWQTLLAIMESAKTLHDWAEALPAINQ